VSAEGTQTLTQSMAIIEYLDDSYPKSGLQLLPVNKLQRAKAREVFLFSAYDSDDVCDEILLMMAMKILL